MTRVFALIWMAAISLSAASILMLSSSGGDLQAEYPKDFESATKAKIVFIGSSLTGFALPEFETERGVLGDGRSSAIITVNNISERLSNRLLAAAIKAHPETIFIEINAYAHDYINISEPLFLGPMIRAIRDNGNGLTFRVKGIINFSALPNQTVQIGSRTTDGELNTSQLIRHDYYRFIKTKPNHPDELESLLANARAKDIEVIFVSSPRPEAVVTKMGFDEFADFHSHINQVASSFSIPLWYTPTSWPDDHFIDIVGHINVRGRNRFQGELIAWYGTRQ